MDGFLTVKDVCRLLHVTRETIRRWEKAGMFPTRVSFTQHRRGRVGFYGPDVKGWIEARRTPSR